MLRRGHHLCWHFLREKPHISHRYSDKNSPKTFQVAEKLLLFSISIIISLGIYECRNTLGDTTQKSSSSGDAHSLTRTPIRENVLIIKSPTILALAVCFSPLFGDKIMADRTLWGSFHQTLQATCCAHPAKNLLVFGGFHLLFSESSIASNKIINVLWTFSEVF